MRISNSSLCAALGIAAVVGVVTTVAVRADDSAGAETVTTGTIKGHVRFAGEVPAPMAMHADHDPEICGDITDETLLAGADGSLANVVVVVQDVADTTAPAKPGTVALDQKGCAFVPHVQTVTQGSTLEITSSDPVLHNVHAFLGKRTVFNLAMPLAGKVVARKLEEPGILRIRCDSGHTWMSAYIAVVPHTFHATSDAAGNFEIPDLPPGEYRLRAWHERLGAVEQTVVVTADSAASASLTFKELEADDADEGVDDGLRDALVATRTELQQLDDRRRADERGHLAKEGRPLFVKYCATCHGKKGNGKGTSARFTTTPPRDFTRGTYKFRMTPAGSPPTRADLIRTIRVGVRGTHMPGWKGKLERSQIETLADYLTTLSDVFWDDTPAPTPLVIADEPDYDQASVARGKKLFEKMQCAACHGTEGRGDGAAAKSLRDDWGKAIDPADFTGGIYKGGKGAAVVFRAVSTGLGGTPMPSFAGSMSEAERWDLAHFVLSLAGEQPTVDYLMAPVGRMTTP